MIFGDRPPVAEDLQLSDIDLYLGTIGQGVWRSRDGGGVFRRAAAGMPSESDVRALLVDRRDRSRLLAGTETGLYCSTDCAESWKPAPLPVPNLTIWSLAQDPWNPEIFFMGAAPASLLRSCDGGSSWQLLDANLPARCLDGSPLVPRITCIEISSGGSLIHAGVEIGGVCRSRDGGATWEMTGEGLSHLDVHGLAHLPEPGILMASTQTDVNLSRDDGGAWQPLHVGEQWPWSYARACAVSPADPHEVWIGAGNGPPGDQGGIFRTRNLGESWQRVELPEPPNSTIWSFGFNDADPLRIYAIAICGLIYESLDGGAVWRRLPREFGELRCIAWAPAP